MTTSGDMLVFDSVAQSNIPAHEKSAIKRWYERLTGKSVTALGHAKAHVVQSGHVLRQYGESLVVGGLLGALHAELPNGLDIEVGGKKAPIDGMLAAAGAVASIAFPHSPLSCEAANAGASGATIWAFRMINEHQAKKKLAAKPATAPAAAPVTTVAGDRYDANSSERHGEFPGTATPHQYDFGVDPIVVAARRIRGEK